MSLLLLGEREREREREKEKEKVIFGPASLTLTLHHHLKMGEVATRISTFFLLLHNADKPTPWLRVILNESHSIAKFGAQQSIAAFPYSPHAETIPVVACMVHKVFPREII